MVRDLCSTDPTQETRPRSCTLYGSHPATWARSYRPGAYLPCLADVHQEVRIDYLSDAYILVTDNAEHCRLQTYWFTSVWKGPGLIVWPFSLAEEVPGKFLPSSGFAWGLGLRWGRCLRATDLLLPSTARGFVQNFPETRFIRQRCNATSSVSSPACRKNRAKYLSIQQAPRHVWYATATSYTWYQVSH